RGTRYLRMEPSKAALARERDKLRDFTSTKRCFWPIPALIRAINRHLVGWRNYFDFGYSRPTLREINRYVRDRLRKHLRRRSQRPYRPRKGTSFYRQFARMGLVYL